MVNVFRFSPVNAGHTRHVLLTADAFRKQPVSNLPSEHCGVLLLVLADRLHHMRGGHLRLAPPDHPRLEVARLIISGKDLGDATMRDPELPGDVTRSDPLMGKLYNPLTNHIGERTTVHKHTAKLVHASMTCNARMRMS